MFKNSEKYLKSASPFLFVAGIIESIFFGYNFFEYDYSVSIGIIAIGVLLSWVSSLVLYGFGELIEYTKKIQKELAELKQGGSS
ncbi:hypothetical protein FACS1894188_04790 [Clostridia bacterium]|nr:hypothetical protein FACS1894188_04790 [Clostridia bacterium]